MSTTIDVARVPYQFTGSPSKAFRTFSSNDNQKLFKDISINRKLSSGKFPIYLISLKINNEEYALKLFPQDGDAQILFKNEIRFANLKHPNVINIVHSESQKDSVYKGQLKNVSYVLMEYAPHGDFFSFILKHREHIEEKLARTYFKQLIDGMEYLHNNHVAHLDLKPENLLLGADFSLKIADFDLSYISGDKEILGRGTPNYRAPETFEPSSSSSSNTSDLEDPFAADIYSAGVILFILKSAGMYPHAENKVREGINFMDLMYKNNLKFWTKHCEIQGRDRSFYTRDFKELFNNMVRLNPQERLTIREIKASRWYNGPVYTPMELKDKMKKIVEY